LKSSRLKKLPAQILPHGEIRPLKITGKIRFLPKKQPRSIASGPFSLTR
jgi:hypothetical protein